MLCWSPPQWMMGPQIEPKNKVSKNTVIQMRHRNDQISWEAGNTISLTKTYKGPHNTHAAHKQNDSHRRIYSPTCQGARSQTSHLGTGRMSLLWAGPSLCDRCRSTSKKQRSVRWPLGACDPTHNKAYRHSVITITLTYTHSYTHTSTNAYRGLTPTDEWLVPVSSLPQNRTKVFASACPLFSERWMPCTSTGQPWSVASRTWAELPLETEA